MWLQIQGGSGLNNIFLLIIYNKCHTIFSYYSGVLYFHKHKIHFSYYVIRIRVT